MQQTKCLPLDTAYLLYEVYEAEWMLVLACKRGNLSIRDLGCCRRRRLVMVMLGARSRRGSRFIAAANRAEGAPLAARNGTLRHSEPH